MTLDLSYLEVRGTVWLVDDEHDAGGYEIAALAKPYLSSESELGLEVTRADGTHETTFYMSKAQATELLLRLAVVIAEAK